MQAITEYKECKKWKSLGFNDQKENKFPQID